MATANLLPTEVAAHECIEHFTLPGTARSNPPGNVSAHSVRVTPVRGHRRVWCVRDSRDHRGVR
jgi:hypothetical protein